MVFGIKINNRLKNLCTLNALFIYNKYFLEIINQTKLIIIFPLSA